MAPELASSFTLDQVRRIETTLSEVSRERKGVSWLPKAAHVEMVTEARATSTGSR